MFENFESDEFAQLLEGVESDESDESFEYDEYESDERIRRRPRLPRPPLPTARRGNAVARKAPPGFATKGELQATANKLDARIATNSKAIQAADKRLRANEADTGRIGTALRKEITERKAATDQLKKGLDESRQLAMLLPLLNPSKTVQIQTSEGTKKVLVESDDKFSKILPILLLSGGLGGSSGGGGLGGGDNNMLMMVALMTAMD